jgi:NTE family protein
MPPASQPHHLITLAFLSEQLPASIISEQLARSLCAETTAPVVLVRLERHDGNGNGDNGAQADMFLQGEFHMPSRVIRTEGGFHFLTLRVKNGPPSPGSTASLIDRLSQQFSYVLIEVLAEEQPAPWFLELLARSDLTYLFVQPTTEAVYHLDRVMRELRPRCQNGGAHVKPVVCLALAEQVDGFDRLVQRVATPVHMFVHDSPKLSALKEPALDAGLNGLFGADVRRLAREIGGCQVGLALSSGAAKGFAHIGVIQVLEENGIEVDIIAAASMGAYIGALWAHGCDGKEMEQLARELEGRWRVWTLIDPVFPPRQGFLRGYAVKKRLIRSIGNERFGDLARPLRVVAGNLETLERVVFAGGEVAAAVHASIAVPGICVPITIDGETYIDGGIIDPLPVDVLREMGVSRVIAVDAIPTPDRIGYGLQAERELARQNDTRLRRLFGKTLPLEQQLNYFARGNLFEILMRSLHGAQIRVAEASCLLADLVLRPDICDDRWTDCRNPGRFIKLGREVTERHLEEIKTLVARKEPIHDHSRESVGAVA